VFLSQDKALLAKCLPEQDEIGCSLRGTTPTLTKISKSFPMGRETVPTERPRQEVEEKNKEKAEDTVMDRHSSTANGREGGSRRTTGNQSREKENEDEKGDQPEKSPLETIARFPYAKLRLWLGGEVRNLKKKKKLPKGGAATQITDPS